MKGTVREEHARGKACAGLIGEFGPFVRKTLAQMGVAARDLADVEQEVYRGAARGLPTFDPTLSGNPVNPVRGWLYGICKRQAASHHRAVVRRGEDLREIGEADAVATETAEDVLLARERSALLASMLSRLEPLRRAVVIAHDLHDTPMAEVAAAQAIPLNTAWNRLRLGREELRAAARKLARY